MHAQVSVVSQIQNYCDQRLCLGYSEENFYLSLMLVTLKPVTLLEVLFLLTAHVSCRLDCGGCSGVLWCSDLQSNPLLLWSYSLCCPLLLLCPGVLFWCQTPVKPGEGTLWSCMLVSWAFPVFLGWWGCRHHLAAVLLPVVLLGLAVGPGWKGTCRYLCNFSDARIQLLLVWWPLHLVFWLRNAFCLALPGNWDEFCMN